VGIATPWTSFLAKYGDFSEQDFLTEVTAPYLLVPKATEEEEEGADASTAIETIVISPDMMSRALSEPHQAYLWAIPLTKQGENPFGMMITVGRARNNDVVLEHKATSKFHAYFRHFGGKWSLCDANSSNGTYLNGMRLPPERSRPLKSGDHIGFGGGTATVYTTPAELYALLT
jgi:hypothetical protein